MLLFIRRVIRLFLIIGIIELFSGLQLRVIAADEPPLSITSLDWKANNPIIVDGLDLGVSRSQIVDFHADNLKLIIEYLEEHPHDSISAGFAVQNNINFIAQFSAIETTLNGGKLLTGGLINSFDGSINLVSTNGIVNAILTDNGQQYQLFSDQSGQYYFEIIDQSQFPPEAEPIIPDLGQSDIFPPINDYLPVEDSGAQIDVMVVYTDDARLAAGGTTNMENLINLAVSETNQGYTRSNIIHRFNLVHTLEVNYNELNGGSGLDWSQTLDQLTNSGDGYLEAVQPLRDFYFADLVVMIVEDSTYCGMGWLMTSTTNFAPHGYSLVSRTCATGYYSFGHETGHNMGAHHDRATTSQDGMYSYSHGYLGPNYAFRTIMAYPNGSTRINNWSNPSVLYNGYATGINASAPDSADNHLTLNNTAVYVANFRNSAVIPNPPSSLQLTNKTTTTISMEFTDNSSNEQGFKVERAIANNPFQQIAVLSANQVTFQDFNLECGINYSYRVRAYNAIGNSTFSNVLNTTTLTCTPAPAPAPIQLFITMHSVRLSWQDVDGETSYMIEQFIGDPGEWILLATLNQNVTSFYLDGLSPNTNYTLRVSTNNNYGIGVGQPITLRTMNTAIFLPLLSK